MASGRAPLRRGRHPLRDVLAGTLGQRHGISEAGGLPADHDHDGKRHAGIDQPGTIGAAGRRVAPGLRGLARQSSYGGLPRSFGCLQADLPRLPHSPLPAWALPRPMSRGARAWSRCVWHTGPSHFPTVVRRGSRSLSSPLLTLPRRRVRLPPRNGSFRPSLGADACPELVHVGGSWYAPPCEEAELPILRTVRYLTPGSGQLSRAFPRTFLPWCRLCPYPELRHHCVAREK